MSQRLNVKRSHDILRSMPSECGHGCARFGRCTTTATSTSASPRRYDESAAEMFDPAVVDPVVDFLAELAGERTRARARDRDRPDRAPARAARSAGARDRAVAGDGREAAREAGRRGHRRDDRRLRDDDRRRDVLGRVPGLQHDLEPDDAGGAGRVLPQRRGAPRARRLLRHRGRRPGAPAAPARRDHPRLPRERDADGGSTSTTSRARASRRITSRSSTDSVERFSMPFRYVWPAELDLMARARRDEPARALERVEARAVHEREPQARLGLGEAGGIASLGSERCPRRASSPRSGTRRSFA